MSYISKITLPNGSTYDIKDVRVSNPNLLINPDFSVNQRGDISYDGSISYLTYFVDRWMRLGGVSLTADGVSICKGNSPYGLGILAQKIENGGKYAGMDCTLSVILDTDKIVLTGVLSDTVVAHSGDISADFVLSSDGTILVQVYTSDTAAHTVRRVKFEVGGSCTPCLSPDPATELIKCQRYYQIRSTGDIAAIDLRPSMRTITDIKQRGDGTYEYIAEL